MTILACEEFRRSQRKQRRGKRGTFPCPNVQSSTTFMANRDDLGFGTDEVARKRAVAKARARGISTSGYYNPQLQMWIDSKDQLRRVCEQRGLQCEGLVNVKGREPDVKPEPYRVADDIVEREVETVLADSGNPEISRKERATLTEDTRERLSPVGGEPC